MVDIVSIVDRLKAETTALRQIGMAADLAAVLEGKLPNQTGTSAFVLVGEERGGQASLSVGSYIQPVQMSIAVILTFREISNRAGDKLIDDVEAAKKQVRDALIGWIPDGANGPLRLVQGAPVSFKPGLFAWGYQLATSTQLRIAR
jgi:hypothetical protein